MPEESTGAGAPHEQPTEGQQPGAGASTEPTQPMPAAAEREQPSANQLIKQFAKEQGISVEELLDSYKQLKTATQTESERLEGERDRYKGEAERLATELQNLRSEAAFTEAAREARARAPKTLFRAYRDALEFDTAGNPTNIADVIAAAREEEPDLFASATGTSDAGRRGDGAGSSLTINDVFREMAGKR